MLELGPDLPEDDAEIERWCGEPLRAVVLPTAVFMTNKKGYPTLSRRHQVVLAKLLTMNPRLIAAPHAHQKLEAPAWPPAWRCLSSVPAPPRVRPGGSGRRNTPRGGGLPSHWALSHRLGCSSEPPPKSSIPRACWPLQVSGRPDTHAEGLGAYLLYLRHFLSKKPPPTMEERFESPYYDYLQAPLQPLQDNLESQTCASGSNLAAHYSLLTTHHSPLTTHHLLLTTYYDPSLFTRYETFEKDPIKYREYQRAIMLALQDRQSTGRFAKMTVDACAPTSEMATGAAGAEPTVIMVVGAGRGPLVAAALAASQEAGVPIKVYAVEKNENAVVTLQALYLLWHNSLWSC